MFEFTDEMNTIREILPNYLDLYRKDPFYYVGRDLLIGAFVHLRRNLPKNEITIRNLCLMLIGEINLEQTRKQKKVIFYSKDIKNKFKTVTDIKKYFFDKNYNDEKYRVISTLEDMRQTLDSNNKYYDVEAVKRIVSRFNLSLERPEIHRTICSALDYLLDVRLSTDLEAVTLESKFFYYKFYELFDSLLDLKNKSTHFTSTIFDQKDTQVIPENIQQYQTDFYDLNNQLLFTLKHQAPNVGRIKSEITTVIFTDGRYIKLYETAKQKSYKCKFNQTDEEYSFLERGFKSEESHIRLQRVKSAIKGVNLILNVKGYLINLKPENNLIYSKDKFYI